MAVHGMHDSSGRALDAGGLNTDIMLDISTGSVSCKVVLVGGVRDTRKNGHGDLPLESIWSHRHENSGFCS